MLVKVNISTGCHHILAIMAVFNTSVHLPRGSQTVSVSYSAANQHMYCVMREDRTCTAEIQSPAMTFDIVLSATGQMGFRSAVQS